MSMDVRKVKLDFNKTFQQCIPSVQGDTGRSIEFQIMDGGLPEDITGETVKIFGLKPDGFRVFNNATITDARNGKCVVDLTLQMLCVAGIVQCTLVRYKNDEKLSSRKFNIEVAKSVADDLEIESTNEYLALTDALNMIKGSVNAEIINARGTYDTLGDRLDNTKEEINNTKEEITSVKTEVNNMYKQIGFNLLQQGGSTEDTFDNTPILQGLINTLNTMGGGSIYIPEGTFNFKRNGANDYCLYWKSNVSLTGAGMGKTILKTGKNTDNSLYALFYNLDKANLLANCNFSDFTADLSEMGSDTVKYNHKGKVFYFQGVDHGNYERLELIGTPSTALGIDFCNNVFIDKVICKNCGRMWVESFVDSAGNTIEGPGGAGIGIGTGYLDNEHITVTNCICDNCGHYGIFFEHQAVFNSSMYTKLSKGIIIADNIVKNGRGHGIGIRGGNSYNITNNIIYNNNWDGININSGEKVTTAEMLVLRSILIKGNNTHKNRDGIAIDGKCSCYGVDIKDNFCFLNKVNGISINYLNPANAYKERIIVKDNFVTLNKNSIYYKSFSNCKNIIIKDNECVENDNNCGKLKIGNKGCLQMSRDLLDNSTTKLILKIKVPSHSDKICLLSNRDENYNTNEVVKGYSISINEDNKLLVQTCSENGGTVYSFTSNEIIDITNLFYLSIIASGTKHTFSISYDGTNYTNFTFNEDFSDKLYNAILKQPNKEITLFREWCGSYGFSKYGEDAVFYKLFSVNAIDGGHLFEITDNVTKQIKESDNDLYYLNSLRNVTLYLDNE